MKPKHGKTGRPDAMSAKMAASVFYALGRGVRPEDIVSATGISTSTLRRYLNWGLDDERCRRLASLIAAVDRQKSA